MSKPKLEIVRPDDEHVEVWIGGKEVARANYDEHGSSGMGAVEDTARAVAKVLGAEVEETDDPSRQPYRYFLAFVGTAGGWFGHYNAFVEVPDAIEDVDTMRAALAMALAAFAGEGTRITNPALTNFILVDGPC